MFRNQTVRLSVLSGSYDRFLLQLDCLQVSAPLRGRRSCRSIDLPDSETLSVSILCEILKETVPRLKRGVMQSVRKKIGHYVAT